MRYIVYKYTFSILVITFFDDSRVYAIPEGKSRLIPGLKYTFFSLVFGWWGVPMGPVRVIQTLLENFTGGKDVTHLVNATQQNEAAAIYRGLSEEYLHQVDIGLIGAVLEIQEELLKKNLKLQRGPENAEFVSFALQKFDFGEVDLEVVKHILKADKNYQDNMDLAMGYRIAKNNLS